jgi:hypothetical protein
MDFIFSLLLLLRLIERFSFPEAELEVLEHWKQIDAFHTSLKLSAGRPEYAQ